MTRIGSPQVGVQTTGRALERSIALVEGTLVCPRRGHVEIADCVTCGFLCRTELAPASVICSYPIPARETFAVRSRHDPGVRIALRHHLERT